MDNIFFTLPSEIITNLGTLTTTGTVDTDPNYGLAALYDGRLAKPAKFQDITSFELLWDFGVDVRIDGVALPNSNLDAGLDIAVQLHDTNTWGSPTVDGVMTMGPIKRDGHRSSPWVDLREVSGYSAGGFRYLHMIIPANSVAVKLGEILVLNRLREFSQWPQFGGKKGVRRRFVESIETEYGVVRTHRRRIAQRNFAQQIKMSDGDWDVLNELADDTSGYARPFFVVFDGSVRTDGGLYARVTKDTAAQLEATEEWFNVNPFTLAVEELSRSLPL